MSWRKSACSARATFESIDGQKENGGVLCCMPFSIVNGSNGIPPESNAVGPESDEGKPNISPSTLCSTDAV